MLTPTLKSLSEIATEAHTRIQQNFPDINPVIGVNQGMRASGIPADLMTIDCLKTGKRIIVLIHDDQPELIRYQFAYRDKDPEGVFEEMQLSTITVDTFYGWMSRYFSMPQ